MSQVSWAAVVPGFADVARPSTAPADVVLSSKKPRGKRSKKRARDDAETDTQAAETAPPTPAPSMPAKRLRKEDIFRFFDLPAELQNRIYEFAIDYTARKWPVIRNRKLEKREQKSKSPSTSETFNMPPPIFPFLGLTQTCTRIRVAFRGWWMENHRIPLCELERYLSVFHPLPPRKDRHRFQAYVNTAGQLTVWLRQNELGDKDILRLLKLKLRLPNYTIKFQHGEDVTAAEAQGLSKLVNNANEKWLRWLRGHIVTQVRTTQRLSRNSQGRFVELAVVVREQFAPGWMKPTVGGPPPETDELSKTLGLDNLTHWKPRYYVCYD